MITTVVSIFFDLILCIVLKADHKKEPVVEPKQQISCSQDDSKTTSECKEEFDGNKSM